MKLYVVNDMGDLRQLSSLNFFTSEVYLVDDEKTIYLWFGQDVSLNQQDVTVKVARKLNKERGGRAKLLLMNQNREYGAFLAMMGELKEGLREDETIERRPELKMKVPKKAMDQISEKISQTKGGVIDWLQQLQTYRTASPVEKPEPEPKQQSIPKAEPKPEPGQQPMPKIEPEAKPPVEAKLKPKPEIDIETRVVDWLTQLLSHRSEAPVKTDAVQESTDELRDQVSYIESMAKDIDRRRSLHEEVQNLLSEQPKKKEPKREIPIEAVDNYLWEEEKEEPQIIEDTMEDIPVYKELPEIEINIETEERPRIEIESDKTDTIVEEGIMIENVAPAIEVEVVEEVDLDFHSMVNVGAYYLAQKGYTYDELCWLLAEKQLQIQMEKDIISQELIHEKAEVVFNTSCTYDELCWLIAELDIMNTQGYLE